MSTRLASEYFASGEIEAIKFKPVVTPATGEGTQYYDIGKKCMSTLSDIPDVVFNVPLEQCDRAINKTGATIINGTPLRYGAVDAATDRPTLVPAIADSYVNARVAAIATHEILDGEEAWVTTSGDVGDVDIAAVAEGGITLLEGEVLYLSETEAGKITNIPPNIVSKVGFFLNGESGVSLGTLSAKITPNMALPSVVGTMSTLSGTVGLTATPQAIDGYAVAAAIGIVVNPTTGEMTVDADGFFSINFVGATTFAGESQTRKIWLDVVTSISGVFRVPIPLARDIDESNLPINMDAPMVKGDTIHIEISADDNFDITFTNASFSVTATHISV